MTRRIFCCTSFVAPLYAVALASAMIYYDSAIISAVDAAGLTGENAMRKSSLRLALDCWATSADSLGL